MSTSAQSPYPRENWWGETGDTDEKDAQSHQNDRDPNNRYAWVAYQMLRRTGTMLCGRSRDKLDLEIELTDPCIRLGTSGPEMRYRLRYNPETGWINWGHGTWTALQDRPTDEFLTIVEEALAASLIRPKAERNAYEVARRLKQNPDGPHDVDILATVLEEFVEEQT